MSHLAHCKTCVNTAVKWAAVAYVLHIAVHVMAFVISPALGAIILTLF